MSARFGQESYRAQDCARLDSRLRGNDTGGVRAAVFASAFAAVLFATPVVATEWVHCADAGGLASFDYLAGDGLGVLQVAALTITAGERVWASDVAYGPGDPVMLGQGLEDAETILIDAVDPDYAPVAQLRLYKTSEADSYAKGGTLQITGLGAWAVACDLEE